MTLKKIRNHMYKWAASRSTQKSANTVRVWLNARRVVHAEITKRKLGSPSAVVPTVYDIWVRPLENGKEIGYTLKSKRLENLIRDVLNRVR